VNYILLHWLLHYCVLYNVDINVAKAVVYTESKGKPNAVGVKFEQGLFQLRPELFGFVDTKTNIKLGVEYLAKMQKECKHRVDNTFVVCFNRGIVGGAKIKYPKQNHYFKRVMNNYLRGTNEN